MASKPAGPEVIARFRLASLDDIPEIEQLIACSVRGLSRDDYSNEQIESALGSAFGVDSQLVRDGTYFVASANGSLVACGGWSWRKTLFGGDGRSERDPEPLDPARDAARIRAFFVHPDWARRGLGRKTLELCEAAAQARGFTSAELMATLPGQRLYRSCGYVARDAVDYALPGGVAIRFVPMRKELRVRSPAPMWIMVAGPYRTGSKDPAVWAQNLERLNRSADAVLRKGHVPIIGVNLALPIIDAVGREAYGRIMSELSLRLTERCDAILRIDGVSQGADDEVETFVHRGLRVFRSIDEIPDVSDEH